MIYCHIKIVMMYICIISRDLVIFRDTMSE